MRRACRPRHCTRQGRAFNSMKLCKKTSDDCVAGNGTSSGVTEQSPSRDGSGRVSPDAADQGADPTASVDRSPVETAAQSAPQSPVSVSSHRSDAAALSQGHRTSNGPATSTSQQGNPGRAATFDARDAWLAQESAMRSSAASPSARGRAGADFTTSASSSAATAQGRSAAGRSAYVPSLTSRTAQLDARQAEQRRRGAFGTVDLARSATDSETEAPIWPAMPMRRPRSEEQLRAELEQLTLKRPSEFLEVLISLVAVDHSGLRRGAVAIAVALGVADCHSASLPAGARLAIDAGHGCLPVSGV
jgi:hypothetical protein